MSVKRFGRRGSLGEAHTTVKRHSGLLHHLLGGVVSRARRAPKIGASWEGLVVEHTARIAGDRNVYFWGTQSGLTKSMHASRAALGLDQLWIVYPGTQRYALADWSEVLPMADFLTALHAAVKPGGQRVANACS